MTSDVQLLRQAVSPWGGSNHTPRLISRRENAVYDVELPTGRAALRLHRPGYRTGAEILSELQWTQALANGGFAAPRPRLMLNGEMLHTLSDKQFVTVIDWMKGAPIGQGDVPFTGSAKKLKTLYSEVGGLLAQLHNSADNMSLPRGFMRPKWDRDGLTGSDPLWGRYWQAPCLSASQMHKVCTARDRARDVLQDFDHIADFGLIHADALRENVFRNATGLSLIDFDDAGFGYRMYELGSCITQSVDEPAYPEITKALLDGYSAKRHLNARSRALFQMFAMLRSFSALGWTIPRLAPDHPKMATYVRRAMCQAEEFLDDSKTA